MQHKLCAFITNIPLPFMQFLRWNEMEKTLYGEVKRLFIIEKICLNLTCVLYA